MPQLSFSDAEYGTKRKQMRCDKFLAMVNDFVP